MTGIARVLFVGGIWNGQRRIAKHDELGQLQETVRDDLGRPWYRLAYDSVQEGADRVVYRNPHYRYVES